MGHLAIVNSNTIQNINDHHPYISIGGKLKKYSYKTISDLFADALTVREGDIIFTWMVNSNGKQGVGFDRYYIANGSVVFDPSDDHPIKIGVKKGYLFNNAVSEDEALYLFRQRLLWNAIGKKSLGRGRSLSHQTLDEDEQLLSLLLQTNSGVPPTVLLTAPLFNASLTPITIDNFGTAENPIINRGKKLKNVPVNRIIWNKGNRFLCEKALEAFLCENLDKDVVSLCSLMGYPSHQIKWLGNYLPYGVAGKNIDIVCELKKYEESIIVVIELKNDPRGYVGYKKIVDEQLGEYVLFIADAFKSYRGDGVCVESVVLTHSPQKGLSPNNTIYHNTKWIGYDIDPNTGIVSFKKLL